MNNSDKCVWKTNQAYACLLLYVDDILIFGTNLDIIKFVKHVLSSIFDMKDFGPINAILGIKRVNKDDDII